MRQADLRRPADLLDVLELDSIGSRRPQRWCKRTGRAGKAKPRPKWKPGSSSPRATPSRTSQACADPLRTMSCEPCGRRVAIYDRLRREAGGLNFQDLLLTAAKLLRDNPAIRRYFRRRFTHLLVDEFQDTDPIQAEVMLLLTADDPDRDQLAPLQPSAAARCLSSATPSSRSTAFAAPTS